MSATTDVKANGNGAPKPAADRRNQVMIGELPSDFLRPAGPSVAPVYNDHVGRVLQAQQQAGVQVVSASNYVGRLSISVVQATLVKNYGVMKMDPYCRVRIGNTVFETPTSYNGGKSPRWNKTITAYLPVGVDSLYIEIFDEKSFTVDNRIAWAHVKIPEAVLQGTTVDNWFPLNGKQGEKEEGSVNIIFSLLPPEPTMYAYTYPAPLPVMMPPIYYPPQVSPAVMPGVVPMAYPQMTGYPLPPPQQIPRPLYTEEDLKQVKDMFPNMESDIVRSVMDANHGNKDATVNALLAMSAE